MNWTLKKYVEIVNATREKVAKDNGVISTETAIVGAVVLTAAIAVAAKFTSLFDAAVEKIPGTLDE